MSLLLLLAIEIPLALLALRRGWRGAALLLLALPLAGPTGGDFASATAFAHGLALLALATCALVPRSAGPGSRPVGALYQI